MLRPLPPNFHDFCLFSKNLASTLHLLPSIVTTWRPLISIQIPSFILEWNSLLFISTSFKTKCLPIFFMWLTFYLKISWMIFSLNHFLKCVDQLRIKIGVSDRSTILQWHIRINISRHLQHLDNHTNLGIWIQNPIDFKIPTSPQHLLFVQQIGSIMTT